MKNLSERAKKEQKKIVTTCVLAIFFVCIAAFLFIIAIIKVQSSNENLLLKTNGQITEKECELSELKDNITNLEMYSAQLEFDIEQLENEKASLNNEINGIKTSIIESKAIEKYVPTNAGTGKSFMGFHQPWIKDSDQYVLSEETADKITYDDGYVKLGERYFVAVKPYYGNVGDAIDVILQDDTVIKCIIGDNKGFENDNEYIHHDGTIVEFMVQDVSTFGAVISHNPEYIQPIKSIKNYGNYKEVISNE